jgi:uncharacterized zinc-type alcohol dehydrogenase-like protein
MVEVSLARRSPHALHRVPAGLDPARTGPLLCAGITTCSPPYAGSSGGRAGGVGLGHMAVKLAAGLGEHVTMPGRSRDKDADAH